jgi:hypothetical protein
VTTEFRELPGAKFSLGGISSESITYRKAFLLHHYIHRAHDFGGNPIVTSEFVRIWIQPAVAKHQRARARHMR